MDSENNTQQPNIQPNSMQPLTQINAPKTKKKTKIIIAILSIVALAGVTFGVFELIQNNSKNSEIENLKSQQPETTLEGQSDISENSIQYKNPIISSDSVSYNITFSSAPIDNHLVNISIRQGEVISCGIDYYKTRWVGNNDGGIVTEQGFDKNCEVKGISGKIYKIVEIGEGHDAAEDSIAFILENGDVEYIPLAEALQVNDFAIKGKLKIDKPVIDIFEIGVSQDVGGYASTIFVLSDGSYIKYDKSLL